MTRRLMTVATATAAVLGKGADKRCTECGGTGVVSVVYNNDPDREEDVACTCVDPRVLRKLDAPHLD